MAGDDEEHAVLLNNYFRTLNKRSYVALGKFIILNYCFMTNVFLRFARCIDLQWSMCFRTHQRWWSSLSDLLECFRWTGCFDYWYMESYSKYLFISQWRECERDRNEWKDRTIDFRWSRFGRIFKNKISHRECSLMWRIEDIGDRFSMVHFIVKQSFGLLYRFVLFNTNQLDLHMFTFSLLIYNTNLRARTMSTHWKDTFTKYYVIKLFNGVILM